MLVYDLGTNKGTAQAMQGKGLKKAAAVVLQRKVKLVGGNQMCQAADGSVKRCLRRLGKYGRGDSKRICQHVDPLSAVFLATNPGFDSVLWALKTYGEHTAHRLPPKAAFDDLSWLDT